MTTPETLAPPTRTPFSEILWKAERAVAVDGDTLDVLVRGPFSTLHDIRVRLIGVRAPRMNGRGLPAVSADEHQEGMRAWGSLDLALKAADVDSVVVRTVKAGGLENRYDADVTLVRSDGTFVDVASLLISLGLAVRFEGSGPEPVWSRRGVWIRRLSSGHEVYVNAEGETL